MPLSQAASAAPASQLFDAPPRARASLGRLAPLLMGAVGAGVFVLMAVSGRAEAPAAGAGALAMLVLGGALAWLGGPASGPAPASVFDTAGASDREEANAYAMALELAPNPVLMVVGEEEDDIAARRIRFANAEARELLRVPREGALLVAALRQPAVLEAIDEALFGGIARVVGYEQSGATDRFWRVWTKPLPTAGGPRRQALVIMRDETDVRLNERMRADFLANASHELRTPLASLTGFIETLRGHARDDPEARDRFLAIMARQGQRMARLVDDLLSLSRIELNEHIRPEGRCDLTLAVGDVADALAPQTAAKGVRLALDLPVSGDAVIAGDRDQIVQVIQNLVDNAVKYAPDGGVVQVKLTPELSLEAASALIPGDARLASPNGGRMALLTPVRGQAESYVLLRVDDGGPGMAREHLPRLTERFYRVEGQRSGERLGTGLGLSIVKHIVNRHRGGFFVESAPGLGAAFCVYLPMARPTLVSPDVTKLS
jgi:two-component system phosphate regulon sensor histidine kinase PhoR